MQEFLIMIALLFAIVNFSSSSYAAAAVMSTPTASVLERRQPSVCGGNTSLQQCGAPFPSDFCCPQSSSCLQLASDAMAVLCCPAGQECEFVSPISCDRKAQNATSFPGNQLHSDPTMPLDECGDACCPDGSTCHNGICAIQIATTTPTSSSTPTSTSSVAASSSRPVSMSTTSIEDPGTTTALAPTTSNASKALEDVPIKDAATGSSDAFSVTSFVAGLLPGIVIGVLAVALLMWRLDRRRRRHRASSQYDYADQKHFSTADQLTSLGADPYRPAMHTRSISEPVVDPSNSHRTDFVRGTPSPPRNVDPLNHNAGGYTATASGPTTPARTPKIRALFARSSIFQSPPSPQTTHFPSHLKRGTLTHAYTISPIRALRPKKSSHSLRRQMTADAAIPPATAIRTTTDPQRRRSTHGSTETIQVLMPRIELDACTPDQRSQQAGQGVMQNSHLQPRDLDLTWATVSSSPLYPAPIRRQNEGTPTRVPASQARDADKSLGAPYTPSRAGRQQHLAVGGRGDDARRQTTFSGFMERAGIRPGGG